ncbi:MAG: hypothetical protein R3C20_09155 [Planctomycetaceae bacterium]
MNISTALIDQIVRDVMRELGSRSPSSSGASATVAEKTVSTSLVSGGSEAIEVTEKVVSEDVLAALGAAGRVITLPASSVLTPSGRDYIRRNQVRLTSGVRVEKSVESAEGVLIAIGDHNSGQTAATTAGWSVRPAADEFEAADIAMGAALKHLVVCCGGEPSIVCCVLNRNSSLRAAVVTRNTNLTALGISMNPHIICMESVGWSVVDILRVIRSLNRSQQTPKGWKELSGTPEGSGR